MGSNANGTTASSISATGGVLLSHDLPLCSPITRTSAVGSLNWFPAFSCSVTGMCNSIDDARPFAFLVLISFDTGHSLLTNGNQICGEICHSCQILSISDCRRFTVKRPYCRVYPDQHLRVQGTSTSAPGDLASFCRPGSNPHGNGRPGCRLTPARRVCA